MFSFAVSVFNSAFVVQGFGSLLEKHGPVPDGKFLYRASYLQQQGGKLWFPPGQCFDEVGVLRFFMRWLDRTPEPQVREGLFVAAKPEPRAWLTPATVLAAHLAQCDGDTNPEETAAFVRLFRLRPSERTRYALLFAQDRTGGEAFQPFAAQLALTLGRGSARLEDLLERFYHLASADGSITLAESAFLDTLCDAFGLPGYWRRVDALQPHDDDPYHILGIHRDASDQEVRAAFRRLSRLHHPDAVMARGDTADDDSHMATINAAYRRIMRQRRRRSG